MSAKAKDYLTTMKRLNTIIGKLYLGEALSVSELANELKVSPRTIQRYFNNYLKKAEFPIEKQGKKWILKGANKPIIDKESKLALEAIEELSREIGIDFYKKIKPLLSKLYKNSFNPFYAKIDFEDIGDKLKEALLIKEAIEERRVIKCEYNFENYKTKIEIKPLQIANFEGFWYVIALDTRNDKIKKYLLKKVGNIKILDSFFERNEDFDARIKNAVNVWFNPDNKPFEVILFADKIAAKYIKKKPIAKNQTIIGEDSDGSIEISIKITEEMEIIPFIKSWIPHIIVLEPKSLAKKIKENINDYLKLISD